MHKIYSTQKAAPPGGISAGSTALLVVAVPILKAATIGGTTSVVALGGAGST